MRSLNLIPYLGTCSAQSPESFSYPDDCISMWVTFYSDYNRSGFIHRFYSSI
jgi:hypothetical protein